MATPRNRIAQQENGQQTHTAPLKIEAPSDNPTLVLPRGWDRGIGMIDGMRCVLHDVTSPHDATPRYHLVPEGNDDGQE